MLPFQSLCFHQCRGVCRRESWGRSCMVVCENQRPWDCGCQRLFLALVCNHLTHQHTHSYNTPTPPNSTHSPLPKPPSLPPINSPHPRQLSLLIPRQNHGIQPPPRPHPNPSAHASKPYTASPCHHRADGPSTRTPARVRSWYPVPPLVRAVVSVEVSCNSEMSMRTDCRGHFGGAVRCQDEGEGCWEKICRGRKLLNRLTPPRGC